MADDAAAKKSNRRLPEIEFLAQLAENVMFTGLLEPGPRKDLRIWAIKGSVAMAVDQKIQDALKLSKLKTKLPKSPRIVDIRVEEYVDTSGEDALRVTVILDEDVEVEKLRAEDITAMSRQIRARVREEGLELWPYVQFVKQSELDAEDEE